VWDLHFCSYWCVFFVFLFVSVFPSLVLFVASWGSVDLVVFSSLCEWRFLYTYERYFLCFLFFWAIFSIYEIASPGLHPFLVIPWTARVPFLSKPWVLFQFIVWRNWTCCKIRGRGGRDVCTSLSYIGKILPKREIQNSKIKWFWRISIIRSA